MFLIIGISPKTITIDNNPRICPFCGLAQAYYKRVDHYFNLFFIPLFRVKKGEPFIMCERCEKNVSDYGKDYNSLSGGQDIKCKNCGKTLNKDFKYCPFCGKHIK
ncbi:MAG: zinc ribbon domain-containing protein [Thermodesulfobacteriota bacterium]|nr:zinc ribbon domain-containing protein [Thermodesulfobacteriota bacterium]